MIKEGKVGTVQGEDLPVRADTLCIHGDQAGAVMFAQGIRQALKRKISPCVRSVPERIHGGIK